MPSPGTSSQGDGPSGKTAGGSDSPWSFVMEASPALFPNRAGTIESRAERARDGRRAAIRTVGRAEALSTLSAMSRSLRRKAGAPVSSSSSDASEEDLLETTREGGTLRELLMSMRSSAGGPVGRETGEKTAARLARPLERSVERALRGEEDSAEDAAEDAAGATTSGSTRKIASSPFPATPGFSTRAPANSASGTPSAAPTPSRFSSSLAAQKQMHRDLMSEAARRRLAVRLQAVEEPPILVTPVQRKYIMRWVDLHRGTLRSVADVALAALKKARTDKAYAARVRAENERARLARLERIRAQLADFRRSDPRARWKKACDALHFVSYVKRLTTLSRKANATAAVRRQRLEREAAERAAAEARGETLRETPPRANDGDARVDVSQTSTDDPISLRDAEKARLASSLAATKKALDSRFGSASRGDGEALDGDADGNADGDADDIDFEPKLGQPNAALFVAKKATRDMGEKEYRELSFALKEEEKREALERIGKAQREFHWRPVTRVRLAHSLPLELFQDDDAQYDEAVLAAGKTLRDAGVRSTGMRAAANNGGGGADRADAVGDGEDFDRSFKVKKKTPAPADANTVKAHYKSGKEQPSTMDEEAARAVAMERHRRAARLSAAYDANLAAARAAPAGGRTKASFSASARSAETKRAFASVSGKISLHEPLARGEDGAMETPGPLGTEAGAMYESDSRSVGVLDASPPPMRFGVSSGNASRLGFDAFAVSETGGDVSRLGFAERNARRREEKEARVKQYAKWYVPASKRDAAAFAESEQRWAEKRGGAPAAEVKALKARESQIAAKNQKSYAARIYKSWLDARCGKNARVPSYMRDVEAHEDGTWWEKSSLELVREENERLARSRSGASEQTLRFAT